MNPVIAVYSRDGNGRCIAEILRGRLGGAEIRHLRDTVPRRGLHGFTRSVVGALIGRETTVVGQPWRNFVPGSELYLISPVWCGRPAPAVTTFLRYAHEEGDTLNGITLHIITVQADHHKRGSRQAHRVLYDMALLAGGSVARCVAVTGGVPGRSISLYDLEQEVSLRIHVGRIAPVERDSASRRLSA